MPFKSDAPYLGEFELLVLLAILRLGDAAYGVTIRDELEQHTSRDCAMGTIYKTLGRLEEKGYVTTRVGEPIAERGGRRRKLYTLRPLGTRAVNQSVADLRRMTRGFQNALETQ